MASKGGNIKFSKVELVDKGIPETLQSEWMKGLLEELGAEIVRDIETADPDGEYDAQLWKERRTRYVMNIRSTGPGAFFREAENGVMARKGKKRRGTVK